MVIWIRVTLYDNNLKKSGKITDFFSALSLDIYLKYIQWDADTLKAGKFSFLVMYHSWPVHVHWLENHGGESWLSDDVQRGKTVGLCVLNASFTHF